MTQYRGGKAYNDDDPRPDQWRADNPQPSPALSGAFDSEGVRIVLVSELEKFTADMVGQHPDAARDEWIHRFGPKTKLSGLAMIWKAQQQQGSKYYE